MNKNIDYIYIFMPDNHFFVFQKDKDEEIRSFLKELPEEVFSNTEIAFKTLYGGNRFFYLSTETGKYLERTNEYDIPEGYDESISFESCAITMAALYDIPIGSSVYWIPEGIEGMVVKRKASPIGIKYDVEDENGNVYEAYDTALEILEIKQDHEQLAKVLYQYLFEYTRANKWSEAKVVPLQLRAIFTTLCCVSDIEADTKTCDDILRKLYAAGQIDKILGYDDFENYMLACIV